MAKATTIWVSTKTKEMADKFKGKNSYNQHYTDLMEMYANGGVKIVEKPVYIEKEKPVYIEKEKPIFIEKETPVIVEREVAVEKPCESPKMNDVEKQLLMEEIRETVAAAGFNPVVLEEIKQTVRKEVENQFWLNFPKHCRNCGYPTTSGASEPVPIRKKESIFTMLV